MEAEETALFVSRNSEGDVARLGLVRRTLSRFLGEAREAGAVLARALSGCRELERAEALEADRDLVGAASAYARAVLLHPDLEVAQAGRARTLREVALQNERAALLAVQRRDWPQALSRLDELLELVPRHEEARDLRDLARRELASQHALEARRFEESRLQGNALVHYVLALGLAPGEELEQAVSRNEAAIEARLQPRVAVKMRSVSAEEQKARRALWRVEEETLSRAEQDLLRVAQERVDELLKARYGPTRRPAGGGRTLSLLVEDLEFIRLRGSRSTSRETVRFVESVRRVSNPDYQKAVRRRDAARAKYEQVMARLPALSGSNQRTARDREPFLRLDWEQLETLVHSLPPEIPSIQWGSAAYSRVSVSVHLELSARYRFDGAEHWASSVLELEEEVVAGDAAHHVAPDPDESMSRSGALRTLAPRLARTLGEEVERLLMARHERYRRDALGHIERGSFDLAVEELVAFILSRGRADTPHVREAARLLEEISGCDLLERRG